MTRPILADFFDHNVWATLRLIDACRPLTDEQLATVVPGTYGSILDMFRHIVGADCSYLEVLSGGKRQPIDEDAMGLDELRTEMERNGPLWREVVAGELDAARPVTRYRPDGSTSTSPQGIRLAQVPHHGTDHRSQIATALTILGIEPPTMDVWDYGDAQGWLDETPPTAPAG